MRVVKEKPAVVVMGHRLMRVAARRHAISESHGDFRLVFHSQILAAKATGGGGCRIGVSKEFRFPTLDKSDSR
jgi:hypothetical protein